MSKDLSFQLLETSPEKCQGFNPYKAAGIDNLSVKFLKEGARVLVRPISRL